MEDRPLGLTNVVSTNWLSPLLYPRVFIHANHSNCLLIFHSFKEIISTQLNSLDHGKRGSEVTWREETRWNPWCTSAPVGLLRLDPCGVSDCQAWLFPTYITIDLSALICQRSISFVSIGNRTRLGMGVAWSTYCDIHWRVYKPSIDSVQ